MDICKETVWMQRTWDDEMWLGKKGLELVRVRVVVAEAGEEGGSEDTDI